MLKLKFNKEQDIDIVSKNLPQNYLVILRMGGRTPGELGETDLIKGSVNIINMETN